MPLWFLWGRTARTVCVAIESQGDTMIVRTTLIALAAFLVSTFSAAAQTYPTRPVTIVVPYTAGGTPDVTRRDMGRRLEQRLGRPFIVEYKPGAASGIGAAYVARAAPDGYTILLGT